MNKVVWGGVWRGLIAGVAGVAASAWAQEAAQPTFVVLADRTAVLETRTKLTWARCVEGMQWDGSTCTGEPLLLTHAEALARAKALAKEQGVPWRVPRAKELQGLQRQWRRSVATADAVFPERPLDWHWSATSTVDTRPVNPYDYSNIRDGVTEANVNRVRFLHGWVVDMENGQSRGDVSRKTKLYVRLVR